jgi:hypothetical protein
MGRPSVHWCAVGGGASCQQYRRVTGLVMVTGPTTIEGAVVKCGNPTLAPLKLDGTIGCRTTPYRSCIFTAKDDNSVGGIISGSTGQPSGRYANVALLQAQGIISLVNKNNFVGDHPIYDTDGLAQLCGPDSVAGCHRRNETGPKRAV